jgi:hypothetical protein
VSTSTPPPAGLLPEHWAELQASGIAADVAALNVASFGPGTDRHWETERAELVRHARRKIQTESRTGSGHAQGQAGHLAGRLIALDKRYSHLSAGGWRSTGAALPGLEPFDQWKPTDPRQKGNRDEAGQWVPLVDQHGQPVPIKYEAPPSAPDGGGLLLPHVPERCWRLICDRQNLPQPSPQDLAEGFWPWALRTPRLELLPVEGWKKALAAVSAGYAAIGLPGVTMGIRRNPDGSHRLIPALAALSAGHRRSSCTLRRKGAKGRRWRIAFDAEAKASTAAKVGAAAGTLARTLRAAGGRPKIARLPLLPGTTKTGLDDLLAAQGPDALADALATTGGRPVIPAQYPADAIGEAGAFIGQSLTIPSPEHAPLVVLIPPMGCGKTYIIADHIRPMVADGIAGLMPSHRKALGQSAAAKVGIPWRPLPGSDERQTGMAACLDSWRPSSAIKVSPTGWAGAVMNLGEWAQQVEHLLMGDGTTIGHCRTEVLRTIDQQLPRNLQTIADEAFMPAWAIELLEHLTGHRAYVMSSHHRPMAGRRLHAPQGFADPQHAGDAFRVKWAELVTAGQPFMCWSSAQQGRYNNSAQNLAQLHKIRRPDDLIDVIDSTTPEMAAELAKAPNAFAKRRTAEAHRLGVNWALYCTPAISSGLSFDWNPKEPEGQQGWKPAAVIAYTGGCIAPEHVAQALGRVRCPDVPCWLFAPSGATGASLRPHGASDATDPAQLIADLRRAGDPLLGDLQAAGADGAWLQAWAALAAQRNAQAHAYAATIAGLLDREGWTVETPAAQDAGTLDEAARGIREALGEISSANKAAEELATLTAEPIDAAAAAELHKRRRTLTPDEQAALARYQLLQRWGLLEHTPQLIDRTGAPNNTARWLFDAEDDNLRRKLREGWILNTPEALALIPLHDHRAVLGLDPTGQLFGPDRLKVALAQRIGAYVALGLPQLLERFAAGETIAANDPQLLALHANACAHGGQLVATLGLSPGAYASGTARELLDAVGWKLSTAGRIKQRNGDRDLYTYTAAALQLPQGLSWENLAAVFMAELEAGIAGANSPHTEKPPMAEKSPTHRPAPPPSPLWAQVVAHTRPIARGFGTPRTGPPPRSPRPVAA